MATHTGEDILHFVWRKGHFQTTGLRTTCGLKVEVEWPGRENPDEGPDFLNARIRLNGMLWVGNVEIHARSSHWTRHGHHENPMYDNVILHVAFLDDGPSLTAGGRVLPLLLLPPDMGNSPVPEILNTGDMPCRLLLQSDEPLPWDSIWTDLASQRIRQQCDELSRQQRQLGEDWESLLQRCLARGFGAPLNILPFEMLSRRISPSLVLEYRDSLEDLESLLLGTAGFLKGPGGDSFVRSLVRRYKYLEKAHHLTPLPPHLWRHFRLRPRAFPELRIAHWTQFLSRNHPLIDRLIASRTPWDLVPLFGERLHPYWDWHYRPGRPASHEPKQLGRESIETILLNSLAPFFLVFGKECRQPAATDLGLRLYDDLGPEKNAITKKWNTFGLNAKNALQSQGMLQLHKELCMKGRCGDCPLVRRQKRKD